MTLIINLSLLILIGFAVGLERQKHHKVIGIRSTTLTLLGAFTYAYISTLIGGDPARIIAQIVTGVSFIGAGIIWKGGTGIHNLTTAILVWVLAAVGCLIALSFRLEAIVITIVIMIVIYGYELIKKDKKDETE